MDKLTNEEIARVFSLYGLNTHVISIDGEGKVLTLYPKCVKVSLNKILPGQELHGLDSGNGGLHRSYPYYSTQCKLILTPLSNITDEHAIEVAKMNKYTHGENDEAFVNVGKSILDRVFITKNDSHKMMIGWDCYQYLIQQGYSVPLFFAPDHWANSKTAIELGIAIEKPNN